MTYCKHCKDKTSIVTQDNGFFYEYGSERGYHVQNDEVCSTCGYDDVVELYDDYDAKVIARYQQRYDAIPERTMI
jgi:uncharacterized protein YacL (UPF0231 family)